MNKETKESLKRYKKYLAKEAKKFKLSADDFTYLYEVLTIINWQDYKTLRLNKVSKWLDKFYSKLDRIVIPERYE